MTSGNYFNSLPRDIQKYFLILHPVFPVWLEDYIATPEMSRLSGLSQLCGTNFLDFWDTPREYSILDHSVGCALIVWHFTRNKKQTLAALFHDIASPAFKHCIDIMNGDALTQESTERSTFDIIKNSTSICKLLKRDGLKPKDVADYHQYPIADNDSPRLSSDRLEYNLMNAYLVRDYGAKLPLSKIKRFYNNLIIGHNEDGEEELAFLDYRIAEEFICLIQKIWHNWSDSRYQLTGKIYAELVQKAIVCGDFTEEDLYQLTDGQAVDKLLRSKDKNLRSEIRKFMSCSNYYTGDTLPNRKYYHAVESYPIKTRFLDPLVCCDYKISLHGAKNPVLHTEYARLSTKSKKIKSYIRRIKNWHSDKYAWVNFQIN
ncbi:hypothetical protein IJG79_01540 [Candidatus Saccharibacteria bacterium]|nr:hypothetical protein [Candidatus Saccharibacteria bacterium]